MKLRTTHYALRTTHYALRTTHYALRTTHYALRTTHTSSVFPCSSGNYFFRTYCYQGNTSKW